MAYESNFVTMVGNLTDDPELRFTPNGTPVCNIRVASNRRWTGRDGQTKEETTFMNVSAWRDLAENVAETLHKGDRAVVIGRIRVRSYDDRDGITRWVTEIEADEIAPSLRWAKATVTKTSGRSAVTADAGAYANDGPSDDDVPF